ncbi:hypothetical protein A0H76_2639 [Hepatospora eriocheir]|uniref:Uncharacterized protein n=1 Tax=Hepatospora eriocheir TaxID=1081669 RepID=A0A1X0QJJ5_9MICR|nr:hypothetical protein A0H76_2639 [Hepatospora eriocheir]
MLKNDKKISEDKIRTVLDKNNELITYFNKYEERVFVEKRNDEISFNLINYGNIDYFNKLTEYLKEKEIIQEHEFDNTLCYDSDSIVFKICTPSLDFMLFKWEEGIEKMKKFKKNLTEGINMIEAEEFKEYFK